MVFGDFVVPTLTYSPFTQLATTNFDMLTVTSPTIAPPVVTISPTTYSEQWTLYDSLTNLPSALPMVQAVSAMVVSDIPGRLQYFGTHQLYWMATINDSSSTQTTKFYFTIDATDACRTATVNAQSITLPSVD